MATRSDDPADRPSMVHQIEVRRGGQTYVAAYFIEHGIIHAQIGERFLMAPMGSMPAENTVRMLLEGQLQRYGRRMDLRRYWGSALNQRLAHL